MLSQSEIFTQFYKTIENRGLDLFRVYYESKLYKMFKIRCALVDNAIDGKFPSQESFIADVAPLIIRKDYNETCAFLSKYFENDPLVSLKSAGGTPQTNADIMQGILHNNFTVTRFREQTLLPCFDNLARYGTAVTFTQYDETYRAGGKSIISAGPGAVSPYQSVDNVGKKVAYTQSIHPLNYFQDPTGNYQHNTSYKGFIDCWYVSDLFKLIDNPLYHQENLQEAIEAAKKGLKEEFWYAGRDSEQKDHTRAVINPIRLYAMLTFDGNENDSTIYYMEFVHHKLIRCHPIDVSKEMLPLQTGVYYPRPDMWCGNASLEFKMAYQNLKNWIFGSVIESTMKQNDRMILIRRGGGIDIADINNRHQNSGVVYYDGMEDPEKLMHQVQFTNTAGRDIDWLNREVNQGIQELSPVVNMQNKYNEGGMNNTTLGAAQMQAGLGETMFGFVMKNVGFFVSRIGEICANVLQQNCGDLIPYRPSPSQDEIQIEKSKMLGEFTFTATSTYFINEKGERTDSANMINQVLNWLPTQQPVFQRLNIEEMLKDWLRAWKGNGSDMSKYLTGPQPGAIPSTGAPPAPQPGQPTPPAEGDKGNPPPPDKISVSVSYKDLPQDAQGQLLTQIGIKSQGGLNPLSINLPNKPVTGATK